MLEAYVDLYNLAKDPEYMDVLKYESFKAMNLKENLDKLKAINPKIENLRLKQSRFNKTEDEKLYEAYKFLCTDSHNNLIALNNRHTKNLSSESHSKLFFYRQYKDEEISTYTKFSAYIFLSSSKIIHEISQSPFQEKISLYIEKNNKLFPNN